MHGSVEGHNRGRRLRLCASDRPYGAPVLERLTGGPPAFPVTVHDRSPGSHDVPGELFTSSYSKTKVTPEKEMASRKSLSHSLRSGKGANAQHADLCQSRDPRECLIFLPVRLLVVGICESKACRLAVAFSTSRGVMPRSNLSKTVPKGWKAQCSGHTVHVGSSVSTTYQCGE